MTIAYGGGLTKGYRFIRLASLVLAGVLVVVMAASTIACRQKGEVSENIVVAVSILPQAEFVEAVGGKKVDVVVMVPSGANLHTYEPRPSQIVDLAEAEMYVKVGSGIEFELVWMDKLIGVNREMLVVDCAKGVELIEVGGNHREGEEDEGQHLYGIDPHIWLSPLNARVMVQNIYSGLVQIDPANKDYYAQNRDAYLRKLSELDQDIRDGLSRLANRRFIIYHPAFGYFARDYNLTMTPVEKGGNEPTAAGITRLIEYARENNIKVIFTAPQFNPASAEVIADEIGGRVVFVDPLAGDYIKNLRTVLDEMVRAME